MSSENRTLPDWIYKGVIGVLWGAVIWLGSDRLADIKKVSESSAAALMQLQISFAGFQGEHRDYGKRLTALEEWRNAHDAGREERQRKWDEMAAKYSECKAKSP